jgi:N-glycosylase/DNA lyase
VQHVAFADSLGEGVLVLPDHDVEVLPGVPWGKAGDYFTPAFWKSIAWRQQGRYCPRPIGSSLREELAACMLSGYGIPSEIGLAAFERLRGIGMLDGNASALEIEQYLAQPMTMAGRQVRYRFFRSKGRFLARAMAKFDDLGSLEDVFPSEVRSRLLTLPGVGPKTASYVVRNYFGSDDVAILDVHITRASKMMRVFSEEADPQRHYFELERQFLDFARAIDVRPSVLDNLIWHAMRILEPATRSQPERAAPTLALS